MKKLDIQKELMEKLNKIKKSIEDVNPISELALANAAISFSESHCDGSCSGKCTKSCQRGCISNCGRYVI